MLSSNTGKMRFSALSRSLYTAPLTQLPNLKGIYVLIYQADITTRITIGKLGQLQITPGYYLYIGSAKGSGGIRARVNRHQNPNKKPHWHIDYLSATLYEVWISASLGECECVVTLLEQLPNTQRAMPNFGASDCRCGGHLLYTTTRPTLPQP